MILFLMDAALRSLFVAMAVWTGLRLFRISNVLAQKAAWSLVLGAAVLLPILLSVTERLPGLPASATIALPEHPLSLLAAVRPAASNGATKPVPAHEATFARQSIDAVAATEDSAAPSGALPGSSPLAVVSDAYVVSNYASSQPQVVERHGALSLRELAWFLYLAVAAVLLFRLALGTLSAYRLWRSAEPVRLCTLAPLAAGMHLRLSRAIASPVTVGSSVILPADCDSWDGEKLRIVLAHERSHIKQRDFYLQMVAGLYAALFWFSPLGWWLKRKLSDLAEALSDHAGLQQAASRSSYAQVLLEFAAAPRPTLIGVAMARTGSISRRIERLLNDTLFREAFAGTRRRALIAALLVPAALFAATAMVRVQAASQAPGNAPNPASDQTPPQPAAPAAQPEAPISGVSTPEQPSDAAAPSAAQAPSGENEPKPMAPQVAPMPPGSAVPSMPNLPRVVVVPKIDPKVVVVPPMPRIEVHVPQIDYRQIRVKVEAATAAAQAAAKDGYRYRYAYSSNGESYGIVRGNGEHVQFSGDLHTADIDKIRKLAHGDFLWFKRDGKYYYVDDPATLAEIEEMYKPMELLGKQQEELGRKQELLGKQQEELGHEHKNASVPTPDVSKEIDEINAAVAKLKAKSGKTVTQEELADLQSKLGNLQGKLGSLQGQMGSLQGDFGAKMGKLGAMQGELGAQQGRLGAEQGRFAQQADQKVKSIIDQSLKNGKAHPVD